MGSGAGGGIAAWVLAEAGYKVVVLEKGPWLTEAHFSNDDLKHGYRDYMTQDILIEPRTFRTSASSTALVNHANPLSRCVGGGSVHYGAASFRFAPDMFRSASLFGVPPGSTLVDWPITYDDLEPHYAAVEQAVGIAGLAPGFAPRPGWGSYPGASVQPPANPLAGQLGLRYSQQYPIPPVNQRYDGIVFRQATDALGYHAYPTPCAINTMQGFQGRNACVNCGFCNGWGCPNGAKGSTLATVLQRAVATGRCEIRAECCVIQVVVKDGRARSVLYVDRNFNIQEQPAEIIMLACSAIDTPRLALVSGLDRYDSSGMIGRNLTNHHNPGVSVTITDQPPTHSWDNYRGVWNATSIDDFVDLRQLLAANPQTTGNPVYPRGGVTSMAGPSPGYPLGVGGPISLAVGIAKTPGFYTGGGNSFAPHGGWGAGFLNSVTQVSGRQAFIDAVCEDLPQTTNMVDLDPSVKDVYGLSVARVTYNNHPNDLAVSAAMEPFLVAIGQQMLKAIGAQGTAQFFSSVAGIPLPAPTPLTSNTVAPRFLVHQHGTMRMGFKASDSVTNRCGQMWGVPNLFIADGSLFPTSGGYNPTHTIEALAHWVATCIAEQGADILKQVQGGTPNTASPRPAPSVAGAAAAAAGATVAAAARRRRRRSDAAPPDAGT